MDQGTKEVCQFALWLAIGCALIGLICIELTKRSCYARWQDTYETRFDVMGGCRVKKNGHWIPTEAIRDIQP